MKKETIKDIKEGLFVLSTISTIAITAISVKNCKNNIITTSKNETKYVINYTNDNNLFEFSSISLFVTFDNEYKILINYNDRYYSSSEDKYYYLINGESYSILKSDDYELIGEFKNINEYLNENEILKQTFTLDEIKDIEKRLNNRLELKKGI